MSTSHQHTASGRPLRVAPAWVGAPEPTDQHPHFPVREQVWIWSVRRYARLALWALPAAALLQGWAALGVDTPPGPDVVRSAAAWLSTMAVIALAGLLAGSRTRRSALLGLAVTLAGMLFPPAVPQSAVTATATAAAGWLLMGWAVFRSKLVNPADGVLLMLAAITIGAGTHAPQPLPTVGALLLLAAGTGLAWTAGRLIPRH